MPQTWPVATGAASKVNRTNSGTSTPIATMGLTVNPLLNWFFPLQTSHSLVTYLFPLVPSLLLLHVSRIHNQEFGGSIIVSFLPICGSRGMYPYLAVNKHPRWERGPHYLQLSHLKLLIQIGVVLWDHWSISLKGKWARIDCICPRPNVRIVSANYISTKKQWTILHD